MKTFLLLLHLFQFIAIPCFSQITGLSRIGQTPGGCGYSVNYDSLSKRLFVGCGANIWVYDASNTASAQSIKVTAKRPVMGLVNETNLYGDVLFAAATHDGLYALDANSDSLTVLAHYKITNDSAVYQMCRTNDTLYAATGNKIHKLKYASGTFSHLATFGAPGSSCVARRGDLIAVGSRGLTGKISVYHKNNLSTPLAVWSSNKIFDVQNVQFADRRNDIIYVCGGPEDLLFTKSNLFALQFTGTSLSAVDSFTISGGILGYAQMNIVNMDSRNDTLVLATTAAFDAGTFPLTYMPIIDASKLPAEPMQKIGYVVPGLWNFDVALMKGTPYIAMSSEWLGVLISDISELDPVDTLGLLETGGYAIGSKIRHDTLWVAQEGFGLAAYKLDSLYFKNGYMSRSRIFHVFRQFVSDFEFLNDTLVVMTSSFSDIYNLKPWINGSDPVKTDSLGIASNVRLIKVQTNNGGRLVTGWNNILAPPESVLLVDPFSTAHPRPVLDSIHTGSNLYSMHVSGDTLYCGVKFGTKFFLGVYKIENDQFHLIDTIQAPAEINSISVEHGIIATGSHLYLKWYSWSGGVLTALGSYFDWFLNAQGVHLKNQYLYVADKFYGMKVFTISSSTANLAAQCKGTAGWENLFGSVHINVGDDGQIYLSDFLAGVIIIQAFDSSLVTPVSEIYYPETHDFARVFPNPNNGTFTIRMDAEGRYDFEIFNVLGCKVDKFTSNALESRINISGKPKGFYFVKIFAGNRSIIKKIIVE